MRRFLIMLTALVSASISFTTSAAGDYRTYVNERYGYSISYPTSLVPQPVSGSGDGRIFNSKTGDAELRVYASTCYESPDEYVAGYEREQKTGNLTVTYSRKGKGYVVVSGLKKDAFFTTKYLFLERATICGVRHLHSNTMKLLPKNTTTSQSEFLRP